MNSDIDATALKKNGKFFLEAEIKDGDDITVVLDKARSHLSRQIPALIDGLTAAKTFSHIFDHLVCKVFSKRLHKKIKNQNMALIAVGGYGRGVLAPFSDIDLLFLVRQEPEEEQQVIIRNFLYAFWDAGVEIGYAVNTCAHALKRIRQDKTAHTAFLDARFLVGDQKLYDDFIVARETLHQEIGSEAFIKAKLIERNTRHRKRGDSRYLLEPNIKENKGALRDLDMLHWIVSASVCVKNFEEWQNYNLLNKKEAKRFLHALRFLWTLRWQLHYMAKRKEEILSFNDQIEIARLLNYEENHTASPVEQFMRDYFLVARDVGLLTHTICAALDHFTTASFAELYEFHLIDEKILPEKKEISEILLDGFALKRDMITVPNKNYFRKNPMQMIRVFHLAGQIRRVIHPETLSLLSRNLHLLVGLRDNKQANRYFLDLLSYGTQSAKILSWMNHTGVLEYFLPDFKHLIGQMQFDMYHVYTTDEHILHAMRILNEIDSGLLKKQHPMASLLIKQVLSRDVLYFALFIHDIAKGLGGCHSRKGEKIALKITPRFGFSSEETKIVAWLIRHHLIMSDTAFKRDLNDPKTIDDFVSVVQSLERLRLLLCLTVADIRAVGPEVWTEWKAALLRELYTKAETLLRGRVHIKKSAHQNIDHLATRLYPEIAPFIKGWGAEKCKSYFLLYPYARLAALPYQKLADEMIFLDEWKSNHKKSHIVTKKDEKQATIDFMIVTFPKTGQLSALAGVFACSSLSIIHATSDVLADGCVIYHFHIDKNYDDDQIQRMKRKLYERLALPLDKTEMPKSVARRSDKPFPVTPKLLIDNKASHDHTLVEVSGYDRPGLLYDLFHSFDLIKIRVWSAKIATYGEMATDVFYVKDIFGLKITSQEKKKQLEKAVLNVFDTAS